MIQQIRFVGEHFNVANRMKDYAIAKIGRLDKYLTQRARRVVRAEVVLRQAGAQSTGDDVAEVLLYVPGGCLKARASSDTSFAAIDLVEKKLRQQIERYRGEHNPRFYQHLMRRLQGKAG